MFAILGLACDLGVQPSDLARPGWLDLARMARVDCLNGLLDWLWRLAMRWLPWSTSILLARIAPRGNPKARKTMKNR